jgi:hypothetical protein
VYRIRNLKPLPKLNIDIAERIWVVSGDSRKIREKGRDLGISGGDLYNCMGGNEENQGVYDAMFLGLLGLFEA